MKVAPPVGAAEAAIALAQPPIRALHAYDPGHDLVAMRRAVAPELLVELGSNENPYGPAPGVRAAMEAALVSVHRYPDPFGGDLKRALAEKQGVAPAQVILGNGSHELLMQLGQVFAGPGVDVVFSQYGFAVFAIATAAASATPLTLKLSRTRSITATTAALPTAYPTRKPASA